jgi:hypothetical protein
MARQQPLLLVVVVQLPPLLHWCLRLRGSWAELQQAAAAVLRWSLTAAGHSMSALQTAAATPCQERGLG